MSAEDGLRALLQAWLPPNHEAERPQMQLATLDEQGRPDLRTVLLSEWDDDGFVFHTDSASRKATHLARSPAVALALVWPAFTRQLVVQGTAEPVTAGALTRAYAARSPYLRQLAWQNTLELAQLPRQERIAAWQAFAAERPADSLAAPDTWTGYLVRPDRLTFWESDPDGPSHRVEFRHDRDGWSEHHLAG